MGPVDCLSWMTYPSLSSYLLGRTSKPVHLVVTLILLNLLSFVNRITQIVLFCEYFWGRVSTY